MLGARWTSPRVQNDGYGVGNAWAVAFPCSSCQSGVLVEPKASTGQAKPRPSFDFHVYSEGSSFEHKRGMETLLEAAMDNSDDEDLNGPKNDWSSAEDQLMKGVYWQNNLSARAARRPR